MSEEINHDRRRFFGTVTMTIAAAELGLVRSATAQSGSWRNYFQRRLAKLTGASAD